MKEDIFGCSSLSLLWLVGWLGGWVGAVRLGGDGM